MISSNFNINRALDAQFRPSDASAWSFGQKIMPSSKVKCTHCGADILPETAAATGGYCRSGKCEAERRGITLAASQQATTERRIASGALKHCSLCGCMVRSSRLDDHMTTKCTKRIQPHPFEDIFPRCDVPDWLTELSNSTALPTPIPLASICADSCYYPATGLDASPVTILNGFMHSFIFADYGVKRDDYLNEISSKGFKGFRLALSRDVERWEIVPEDWRPRMPRFFDEFRGMDRLTEAQRDCVPFGHWSIWKRSPDMDDHAGPSLFSLFFLAGEGMATFQGLYERTRLAPRALAIIQPGHAFGNNWTNFFNADGPFWTSIEASTLIPEYLLIGTFGESRDEKIECPFSDYEFMRRTRTTDGRLSHTIDIFSRNKKTNKARLDNR